MKAFKRDPFQRLEDEDGAWTSSFHKADKEAQLKEPSNIEVCDFPDEVCDFPDDDQSAIVEEEPETQQEKQQQQPQQDMSFGSFDSIDFQSPKARSNVSRSIPKTAISPTSVLDASWSEPTTPFQDPKQPVFITDDGFPAPAQTLVVVSPTTSEATNSKSVTRRNSKKSEKPPKPSSSKRPSSSRRHSHSRRNESPASRRSTRSNDGSYSSLDFETETPSSKKSQRNQDNSFASLDFDSDKPSSRRSQRTNDSSMASFDFEQEHQSSRRSQRSHDSSLASLDSFLETSSSRRSNRSFQDEQSLGSFDVKGEKPESQRSHRSTDRKKRSSRKSRSRDSKDEKSSRSLRSTDDTIAYQTLDDEGDEKVAKAQKSRRRSTRSSSSSKSSKQRRPSQKMSNNDSQSSFDLEDFFESGKFDDDQHSAVLTSAAAADDDRSQVSRQSTRSSQRPPRPSRRDDLEKQSSVRKSLNSNKQEKSLKLLLENLSTEEGFSGSKDKISSNQEGTFPDESKTSHSEMSPIDSKVSEPVSEGGTNAAVFGDTPRVKPPLGPSATGRVSTPKRPSKVLTPKIDRSRSAEGMIELSEKAKTSLRRPARAKHDDIDTSLSSRYMANDWDWEQDRTVCGESVDGGGEGFGVPVVHQNSPARVAKLSRPQRTHSDPFAAAIRRHSANFGSRGASKSDGLKRGERSVVPKRTLEGSYRCTTRQATIKLQEKSSQRKNAVRDSLFSALDQLDEEPEDFFAGFK